MMTATLLLLILISVWVGFYQLVKQQGRILLRLDALESSPKATESVPQNLSEETEPDGLPIGTDFPSFVFPDPTGEAVTLEDFRGKRVLLVHWNFECGFCAAIAPELARLETSFEKRNVQLALLAYGDAESNRAQAAAHGLKSPILLLQDHEKPAPFEHRGTPSAYLLDEKGRVAAPFALGTDHVLSLARGLAGDDVGASSSDALQSQLGTDFPLFELPDLAGEMVALEDLRGRGVLLVHWNFDCGFCESIAPELGRLEAVLDQRNVQLVLLAKGDAQSNRDQAAEHRLRCRILLLQDREKPRLFEHRGTPVAYLLDEEGRIAAPFASGADQVLSLAREIASHEIGGSVAGEGEHQRNKLSSERPLTESHIERNGLKAGTPAPIFRLPDLQGRMVSLEEYRGRRVLLVFSDPQCGPCDALAPHLSRLHQEHENNGLALVLVGRGDEEENRRKAEQFGLRFPVVLQEKWKLSKEYGIFATPVAFLISKEGVIEKDVAVGRDAILALAQDGLGS